MMLILLCIPVILWTFSLSRTMQTFKKPPLTVLLCLIVCFTLTSCFNTKNKSESVPDNYSLYSQYVDKVVKKFEPEGFEILNSTALDFLKTNTLRSEMICMMVIHYNQKTEKLSI